MLIYLRKHWLKASMLAICGIVILWFLSLLIPIKYNICTANNDGGSANCDSYHIGPYIGEYILTVVDRYNGLITAVSTALLAFITFRLSSLAHEQSTTARAQLRAYVFQGSAGLYDGGNMAKPAAVDRKDQPGIISVIKNFGHTPAYQVIHWAQMDVLEIHREESLIAPVPPKDAMPIYLAPGADSHKYIWLNRPLSTQEQSDIFAGRRAIYLYGRIDYIDCFDKPHVTTYRLRYSGSIYPPIYSEGGATLTFCRSGNIAD